MLPLEIFLEPLFLDVRDMMPFASVPELACPHDGKVTDRLRISNSFAAFTSLRVHDQVNKMLVGSTPFAVSPVLLRGVRV